MKKFKKDGIIKNNLNYQDSNLKIFTKEILKLKKIIWDKKNIKELFDYMLPNFEHKTTGKNLDKKM